jgi:hypothetical protein
MINPFLKFFLKATRSCSMRVRKPTNWLALITLVIDRSRIQTPLLIVHQKTHEGFAGRSVRILDVAQRSGPVKICALRKPSATAFKISGLKGGGFAFRNVGL